MSAVTTQFTRKVSAIGVAGSYSSPRGASLFQEVIIPNSEYCTGARSVQHDGY